MNSLCTETGNTILHDGLEFVAPHHSPVAAGFLLTNNPLVQDKTFNHRDRQGRSLINVIAEAFSPDPADLLNGNSDVWKEVMSYVMTSPLFCRQRQMLDKKWYEMDRETGQMVQRAGAREHLEALMSGLAALSSQNQMGMGE